MDDQKEILISEKNLRTKTIIAFIVFIVAIIAAIFFWKWLHHQPQIADVPKPLREVLSLNEKVFSKTLSNNHLVKTYPASAAAKNVRFNGDVGLTSNLDSAWKLKVVRKPGDTLFVSLDEIKALPKTEIVFDFKCIEGWSQISHWGGVKFSDFARKYNLDLQTQMNYAGLMTPDNKYYVGVDMASMMHPQTLLCYEMNGKPLPLKNGYPLRLMIPVKYGIKSLKRIGTLFFSNTPPPDYWYERGYDYYSGL
ncbi:MAG TPA: molybdopterin-dependent oxidoreductase [Hanamia sp.]|nr:molybdopterin-dependent oxidoreductase [Hanamia sp.]